MTLRNRTGNTLPSNKTNNTYSIVCIAFLFVSHSNVKQRTSLWSRCFSLCPEKIDSVHWGKISSLKLYAYQYYSEDAQMWIGSKLMCARLYVNRFNGKCRAVGVCVYVHWMQRHISNTIACCWIVLRSLLLQFECLHYELTLSLNRIQTRSHSQLDRMQDTRVCRSISEDVKCKNNNPNHESLLAFIRKSLIVSLYLLIMLLLVSVELEKSIENFTRISQFSNRF